MLFFLKKKEVGKGEKKKRKKVKDLLDFRQQ